MYNRKEFSNSTTLGRTLCQLWISSGCILKAFDSFSTGLPAVVTFTWHLYSVDHRGVTRGGKGAQFPGRQFTMGALNHCRDAELLREAPTSPNNVTSTFFNTVHLPSKELIFNHGRGKLRSWGRRIDQGGAELVFCPGRHLTPLRPWLTMKVPFFSLHMR